MLGQALSGILGPLVNRIFGVVDEVVTDRDKANELKAALHTQLLDNEAELTRSVTAIVMAEANGHSWLQRNWRPLMMVWFAILLGLYWFGLAPQYLIDSPETLSDLFDLLKLGIGGYIIGRSAQQIAPSIASAISSGSQRS